MTATVGEVGRDRAFYVVIAAYCLVAFALSQHLGVDYKFAPLLYSGVPEVAGGIYLLVALPIISILTPTPLATLKSGLRLPPSRVAGTLLFVAMTVFLGAFTSIKMMLTDIAPFEHDRLLAGVDAALHGGDAWRLLRGLEPMVGVIQVLYGPCWFFLLALITWFACLSERPLRDQFLWTAITCWIGLGNLVALLAMSGGPAFYEHLTGDPRFHALTEAVARHAGPASAAAQQAGLWAAHADLHTGAAAGISAFPSMHLSMATLFALFAWRVDRRLGALLIVFAALILVGSVLLGWHYAIDGYVSILATLAVWGLVGWRLRGGARRAAVRIEPS